MDQRSVTFYRWSDMPKEKVTDMLDRRLITGDRMMLAHVYLEKGCIVPKHSHENEQLTYILEGALKHEDSMGNGSVIRPGDVQRMTAGTGVRHSEKNASDRERVHLLQIWILPNAEDLTPGYEEKAFTEAERRGHLRLIASNDGRDDSVRLNQDVSLFASILDADQEIERVMDPARYAWIQVARGAISLNEEKAEQGDGIVIVSEATLRIRAEEPSEILLFDLK